MEDNKEVLDFYERRSEKGRLEKGLGIIEFHRTQQILSKYLTTAHQVIYDIGGGTGTYSKWLAELKHQVHLFDLAPSAIAHALENQNSDAPYIAETGDARKINRPDNSADIVLLMGPLYHLQKIEDRLKVLSECYRVLKKGGLLFAVGISKFSTTTYAISTFGAKNEFLNDEVFREMIKEELVTGNHNRPEKYPNFLGKAYFHTPAQLRDEIKLSHFDLIKAYAIEGLIWFTPELNQNWEDETIRRQLLEIVELTESEESVLGMSPHFMVVGQK